MTDGEVRVYDAAGSLAGGGGSTSCSSGGGGRAAGPLWSCQLITHDPSPRAFGTEARGEYGRWRERVGLDRPATEGQKTTGEPYRCLSRLAIMLGKGGAHGIHTVALYAESRTRDASINI